MEKNNFEGELYLDENTPPILSSFENLDDEVADSFELLEADNEVDSNVIYERVIFKYKDPSSPPNTKKECGKWFKPWGGAKICVGWTIRYKWLYRIGYIRVETISQTDVKKALEDCLKVSAVASLIAGVASGGSAAIAAAELALKSCLGAKLGDKLLSVSIKIKSSRSPDWE